LENLAVTFKENIFCTLSVCSSAFLYNFNQFIFVSEGKDKDKFISVLN